MNSPLVRSLIRLDQFRVGRYSAGVLSVPVLLPLLAAHRLDRLPHSTRDLHRRLAAEHVLRAGGR